jgi:hypothetical protein
MGLGVPNFEMHPTLIPQLAFLLIRLFLHHKGDPIGLYVGRHG